MMPKEQKKKLNDYFEKITGSTFDELLAKAKSDSKKDSSNNNAKIAELKAQLKSLQSQLSDAQSDLNDANSRLSSAQNDYNTANRDLQEGQKAQDHLTNARSALNNWTGLSRYNELGELAQEYVRLNDEVAIAQREASIYDMSSLNSRVQSASSEVSQAQSDVDSEQSTIDQLTSQIQEVQDRIDALES